MVFLEADLYEVTIKYFTACRDSLQVAAIHVARSLYAAWRSKQKKNERCLCPQRAECNNASLCYFFHTCKPPGSWHLDLQRCSTSFSHTYTHIKDLQGSGSKLFCCICLCSLSEPPGLKPEFLTLRTGGSQCTDFMVRARFHISLWEMYKLEGVWCNLTVTKVSWPENKLVIISPPKQ